MIQSAKTERKLGGAIEEITTRLDAHKADEAAIRARKADASSWPDRSGGSAPHAPSAEPPAAASARSQAVAPPAPGLDEAFYRELLDSISRQEMSAEDAAELGLLS